MLPLRCEIRAVLQFYTAWNGSFLPTFRDSLSVKSQKGSDVNVIRKWRRGRQENETDDEKVGGGEEEEINERENLFIYLFLFGFRLGDAEQSVVAIEVSFV
jgi:hypothetical protein